jgi:hypothetical protein
MRELQTTVQRIRDGCGLERRLALADLICLVQDEGLRADALDACLSLCAEAVIGREDLEPHTASLLSLSRRWFELAQPLQRSASQIEWMIDDEYRGIRGRGERLLDLMGYLPGREVETCLRNPLSLTDPRLKLFAAVSLLRRREQVDASELEAIAASVEVRIILWGRLRTLRMESLMPRRWSAPEMLAASELSNWVSHPMEMGVPPEDVELMTTFKVETGGRCEDAYLFRYREYPRPWEPGGGWMAGIVGPYRDGQLIGYCWSAFESWDSRTPEEHIAKLCASVSRCGAE